jgi:hypothetical protein
MTAAHAPAQPTAGTSIAITWPSLATRHGWERANEAAAA